MYKTAFIAAAAFFAALSGASAGDTFLPGNELRELLNNRQVAFSGKGISGTTVYGADGQARTELMLGITDEGSWWIDGDQVCTQWSFLRGGRADCFYVERSEKNTYQTSSGFTVRAL